MQSCLGIFIDNSMIKYAKVIKNGEEIKIESSGTIFFENVEEALSQIIQETDSYKIPISINLRKESYSYVRIFSILNKNEVTQTVNAEFSNLCKVNGVNSALYKNLYILSDNSSDPDMKTAINVSVSKDDLDSQTEFFDSYKLEAVMPEPLIIHNLININSNTIIVNIEHTTTISLITNGEVKKVYQLNDGMGRVLSEIGERENSLSKAYEVCKNMTISSQDTGMEDENEYLDIVMPEVDKIINKLQDILARTEEDFDNLYVTGTGICINNLDIYFQNFFEEIRCDMLRPNFLENKSLTLPVKEYMEVNSAISLALEGIALRYNDVNFKPDSSEVKKRIKNKKAENGIDTESVLDSKEKLLIRIFVTILIFIIGYGIISSKISKELDKADTELGKELATLDSSISGIGKDIEAVDSLTETYKDRLNKATGKDSSLDNSSVSNNALPDFLQQVMFAIPNDVTVVSIENVSDIKMSITVKGNNIAEIDKFRATLSSEEILDNVAVSNSRTAGTETYQTIVGDLPR